MDRTGGIGGAGKGYGNSTALTNLPKVDFPSGGEGGGGPSGGGSPSGGGGGGRSPGGTRPPPPPPPCDGYVKVVEYKKYKKEFTAAKRVKVTGFTTIKIYDESIGSKVDMDIDNANGWYLVTDETSDLEEFDRIYKHEKEDYWLKILKDNYHSLYDYHELDGVMWTDKSHYDDLAGFMNNNPMKLESGTYTFYESQSSKTHELTFEVEKETIPEQPVVITGYKSTDYNLETGEWSWSSGLNNYIECSEEPEPNKIFAINDDQLMFGYCWDIKDIDEKCLFHHNFKEPTDISDSGHDMVGVDGYKPEYVVIDKVRCITTSSDDYYYSNEGAINIKLDKLDINPFKIDQSYVMTYYLMEEDYFMEFMLSGFMDDSESGILESYGEVFSGDNLNSVLGYHRNYPITRIYKPSDLFKRKEWGIIVVNIKDGMVEYWIDDKLIQCKYIDNRSDYSINQLFIKLIMNGVGNNNELSKSFISSCRYYYGRSLNKTEIKRLIKLHSEERDKFVPLELPTITNKTVLAISFNEGIIKDYSNYNHNINNSYEYNGKTLYINDFHQGKTLGTNSFYLRGKSLKISPKSSEFILDHSWTLEFDLKFLLNRNLDNNYIFGFTDGSGFSIGYRFSRSWDESNNEIGHGLCIKESGSEWKSLSNELPVNEWLSIKIICDNWKVSCIINGVTTEYEVDLSSSSICNNESIIQIGSDNDINNNDSRPVNSILGNFIITSGGIK